jgi:hypothetical protein
MTSRKIALTALALALGAEALRGPGRRNDKDKTAETGRWFLRGAPLASTVGKDTTAEKGSSGWLANAWAVIANTVNDEGPSEAGDGIFADADKGIDSKDIPDMGLKRMGTLDETMDTSKMTAGDGIFADADKGIDSKDIPDMGLKRMGTLDETTDTLKMTAPCIHQP